MIRTEELSSYILESMPDAQVEVVDLKGTLDHFSIRVVSDAFQGQTYLNRHRMVQKALWEPLADGRIHALEIKADTR